MGELAQRVRARKGPAVSVVVVGQESVGCCAVCAAPGARFAVVAGAAAVRVSSRLCRGCADAAAGVGVEGAPVWWADVFRVVAVES